MPQYAVFLHFPADRISADPDPEALAAHVRHGEELQRSGVMVFGTPLADHTAATSIRGGVVTDVPFTETKELFAGYTLIQVRSPEEAREWARRFPAPFGPDADGEIEVRRLYELDDFVPGPAVDAFRAMPGNGTPA